MHPKNKNSIPLENLLDEKYITKLFNANLKKNYPEFIRIDKLQILIIKERLGDDFEHVVANYSFLMARVIGKEKKYLRLNIFCSAHSDGSRKKIMEILKFVNRNNISSQKALFYDNKTQAMFYEGVRGQNLYYYIQHQADIKRYVKEVAIKLASLHKLKIDPKLKISKFRSSLWSLDPSNVLGDKEIKLENCKIEIIKLLNYIKVEFKKLKIEDNQKFFIHGDFHPENIIIEEDTKIINIIDFTDVRVSDFAQDIGSFLQQFRFMSLRFYPDRKIEYYQNIFLKNYFKNRNIEMNQDIENRMLFFQAWLSLRSAVFFLRSQNAEVKVNFLIQQSKEFLDQIK